MLVKLTIFGFLVGNVGEVGLIQKFQYSMSSNMAAPYKNLFLILVWLKMTRKPNIGNLTNQPRSQGFSLLGTRLLTNIYDRAKWYIFYGDFVVTWRHMKTKNIKLYILYVKNKMKNNPSCLFFEGEGEGGGLEPRWSWLTLVTVFFPEKVKTIL